ncbi:MULTISPECIES: FMN-binding glutamate synthase family protein [Pseudomonadati]|uniref:FMN-binding glutamate synthase family protein n=1 Tax=unclassified Halobacteriovorax TaxID=2639665 RepID=UPI000CD26A26|nr:FMN-binding glutamate synthase family protein [Halobacteriovorax sp. DA5]POB14480.1 FMN-binding glutamate synthase family protein [Halobacteriovorax sp. DA5]
MAYLGRGVSPRKLFWLFFLITNVATIFAGVFFNEFFYYQYLILVPIYLLGFYDLVQSEHTLKSNYPVVGRFRYVMEDLRPKIYQYFIESDEDGTPIPRTTRNVIYQRAKLALSTKPFGTQKDVYETGYEWINHSMYPKEFYEVQKDLRVVVGSKHCDQKYNLSIFNISAMSFGSLSSRAVEALNLGAKLNNFAHNTGEGGISDYHLKGGGDLIWQIGTGYFGARTPEGGFCDKSFKEKATLDQVKMIELKLSQGAKPGHGGILPARKNTAEIARIRGVKQGTEVDSPPSHKEFRDATEMVAFIQRLRELSGGKPVGIKLCFGRRDEFVEMVEAFKELGNYPDYIAVDGAEGGTGAAPLEFSDSIGTPLIEGLTAVVNILTEYGLKDEIKVIAAGKIFTAFDIVKAIALGADACYGARSMMLAIGCIQALTCNSNKCPVGITTQNPDLVKGLNVDQKGKRVANFHHATVEAVREIVAAAGYENVKDLKRKDIFKRDSNHGVNSYEDIYPSYKTL